MFMFKKILITAIFGLITLITASSVQDDINVSIDEILEQLGNYLTTNTLEKTILPDFGLSGAPIFIDVSLTNLSTVYRTGACQILSDEDKLKVKMNLGLENMNVHVGNSPALQGPVDLEINGANAEVDLTLHPDDKNICVASWDFINLNTLGEIILHTANKVYDGQTLDKAIANAVILFYNQFLNRDDIFINIHLISNYVELCSLPATINAYNEYKP